MAIDIPKGTPLVEMLRMAGIPLDHDDPLNALRYATNQSMAQIVAKLPEAEQNAVLEGFENVDLVYDWNFWGRPNQIPPRDGWSTYALVSGRGFGKELCVDTPVPVPGAKRGGWSTMGEMKAGDTLFDEHGEVCKVVEAHEIHVPDECYRITFSDGTHIDAGADHLWVTFSEQARASHGRVNGEIYRARSYIADWANYPRAKATQDFRIAWGWTDPNAPYYTPWWSPTELQELHSTKELYELIKNGDRQWIPAVGKPLDMRMAETGAPRWNGLGPRAYGQWIASGARNKITRQFYRGRPRDITQLLRPILREWGIRDEETGLLTVTVPGGEDNYPLSRDILELLRLLGEAPVWNEDNRTIEVYPHHKGLIPNGNRNGPAELPYGKERGRDREIVSIDPIDPKPMRCLTVDSKNSMYLAGEGMIPTHNTRAGAEWVHQKAMENPGCRITLVGRTAADIRDVIVDGDSGILNVGRPSDRPEYITTKRRLVWPNGSLAVGFSAEEPDQLRGWQAHYAWGDEIAAWKHTLDDSGLTAWDNMVISTRLGDNPQVLVTTTPKRNQFMFDLLEMEKTEPDVIIVRGSTMENAGALGAAYIRKMKARYEGTRLADQELYGLMLESVEGALWSETQLEGCRVYHSANDLPNPPLKIIAVDPSVAEDPTDDCGIIVAGATSQRRLTDREAWVLDDWSINGAPSVWAQQVVDCWEKYQCPVVVESNQGGALAATVIHSLNDKIPILDVRANEGKKLRADPVTLKYDKGRVHHVNQLPELEGEMTTWVPGETKKSPDRVDALVYAITALLIKPPKRLGEKRVRARAVTKGRRIDGGRGNNLPKRK